MKCAHTHDSGPYVLGALLSAERENYERHLATCSECRNDVAELAVLPGLLGRLDLATVEGLSPTASAFPEEFPSAGAGAFRAVRVRTDVPAPAAGPFSDPEAPAGSFSAPHARFPVGPVGRREAPIGRCEARRRRSARVGGRWRVAAAVCAVAVVAVVAFFSGRAVSGGAPVPGAVGMVAMTQVTQPAAVAGWVSVESFDGGTRLHMRCVHRGEVIGGGSTLRLVVVSKAGAEEQVGSWSTRYDQDLPVVATTAMDKSDILRVELRSDSGTPLLRYDP